MPVYVLEATAEEMENVDNLLFKASVAIQQPAQRMTTCTLTMHYYRALHS